MDDKHQQKVDTSLEQAAQNLAAILVAQIEKERSSVKKSKSVKTWHKKTQTKRI